MKQMKRFLSVILAVVMLAAVFPPAAPQAEAYSDAEIASIRNNLVQYFHDMATVKWECGKDFTVKVGSGSQTYYKGKTYYGMPYAQKSGSKALTLAMFKDAIAANGKISAFIGQSDCSTSMGVVYHKYTDLKMLWCPSSFKSNGFVKVGSVGNYSDLQKGDVLVNSGHIMMVVSVNQKNKSVTVTHQSSAYFKYDPKTDTTGSSKYAMNTRNCSWGVNQVKSYSLLQSGGYQGYGYGPLKPNVKEKVASPSVSAANTDYGQKITLSCKTSGAAIYYTLDGKDPSGSTKIKYDNKPFVITSSKTIKAYAVKSGFTNSGVTAKSVTVNKVSAPAFDVQTTESGYRVGLSSATSGAQIWYTANGAEPIQNGNVSSAAIRYSGSFIVTGSTQIKAAAVKTGMAVSDTSKKEFTAAKPGVPAIRLRSDDHLGLGDAVRVEWNAVPNAYEYDITVLREDGSASVMTASAAMAVFTPAAAGQYTVTVKAVNAFGESGESNAVTVTVHPDVTVTFADDDGTPVSVQQVKYGGNAVPPAATAKTGHIFTGWKGIYTGVKADVTVTAEYEPEQYTITFTDTAGNVLRTKQVKYGEAFGEADIPVVQPETGYAFVEWAVKSGSGNSYTFANGDAVFEPVFAWAHPDLPLAVSVDSALRRADSSGYTVSVRITNGTAQELNAKLITVIKTSYDQLIATGITEVNVPASAADVPQTVPIACKNVGKIAEVYLVANDEAYGGRTGGAYSPAVQAQVTKEDSAVYTYWGEWSAWQTDAIAESDVREVETKTQYAYRDKQTTTSTSPSLDGWTQSGSSVSYGSWGSWSGWSLTAAAKSDTVDVETRTVYYYYHYCDGKGNFAPSTSYTYGKYGPHTLYSTTKLKIDRTSSTGLSIADGEAKCAKGCGSYYYGGTKTQYRYRTRTKTVTYSFWRWGEWSAYGDTVYTPSENREVRSIAVYRYRDLCTGTETTSTTDIGEEAEAAVTRYTLSGTLRNTDVDYAGKTVTVMVYKQKNTDPTEEQMEYITQITMGPDNAYQFDFMPKEEISALTGDYIVAFGVATADRLLNNVDRVAAPKPQYVVTFKSYDGTIVDTQQVEEGADAVLPALEAPEGYELRWNRTHTDITKSAEITAVLRPKTFTLVFVDWANGTVVDLITDAAYGSAIPFPAACTAEGKRFLGWSLPEGSLVAGNTVIEAEYEDLTNTVRFLNRDGSEFLSVQVPYGSGADLPEEEPVAEGYLFLGWNSATPWWNVKADADVEPVFVYAETAQTPVVTAETEPSRISAGFELEVSEEDTLIFYTLDGSEPTQDDLPYEGEAVSVTETTLVRARAFAPGKNPGDVAEMTIEVIPESSVPVITALPDAPEYEVGEDYARICMKLENPDRRVIESYGFSIVNLNTDEIKEYVNSAVSGAADALIGKAFTVSGLLPGFYAYTFFAEIDEIGTVFSETETFEIADPAAFPPGAAVYARVTRADETAVTVGLFVSGCNALSAAEGYINYDPEVLTPSGTEEVPGAVPGSIRFDLAFEPALAVSGETQIGEYAFLVKDAAAAEFRLLTSVRACASSEETFARIAIAAVTPAGEALGAPVFSFCRPGDVDRDGRISAADARLALRRSVGLEDYAYLTETFALCDADRDLRVTAADARVILRASVGLENADLW